MHHSCKVLVVGGGTGGCSMAAKFANKFKDANKVIVLEPAQDHYYQPLFTLIGGGIKSFPASRKPMKEVLPKHAKWLQDSMSHCDPEQNKVITNKGDTVEYDILILAIGLQIYWKNIPGLEEALKNPEARVCSIYSPQTVTKVFDTIVQTKSGNAIFTFPNSPIKCPGAPQKIAYLAEDYFRKHKVRDDVTVVYNTALPVIFGVKKYADSLWKVCKNKGINVNLQTNLIEIDPVNRMATFQKLDESKTRFSEKYSLLHVSPPMGPPKVLKEHSTLTNEAGFLTVDRGTLQHTKYSNIFGIGDCTDTPNSKTMAAIASQSSVLYSNILQYMNGKPLNAAYNGYSSCPLVTGGNKCILAEFDYTLQPLETFPIDQGKEHYSMFFLKKHILPFLYWNLMLRGYWNGPDTFRKYVKPFGKA